MVRVPYGTPTCSSFGNPKMDANEGVQSFNFEVGQQFKSFKEFESQLKHYQDAKFYKCTGVVAKLSQRRQSKQLQTMI
jgi:hypothetical protein